MTDYRVTTIDNPFSPFSQFDDWYRFDEQHGYCTSGYIARIAVLSDDMPETMWNEEFDRAVDEICDLNVLGIYKKVSPKDYENGKWKPIEPKYPEK